MMMTVLVAREISVHSDENDGIDGAASLPELGNIDGVHN